MGFYYNAKYRKKVKQEVSFDEKEVGPYLGNRASWNGTDEIFDTVAM